MNSQLIDRAIYAEQSVIAGLLLDNRYWPEVHHLINADDFLNEQHKLIFNAITHQLIKEQPADILTISGAFNLDFSYIARLVLNIPSVRNTIAYAKIVQMESGRRSAIQVLNESLESISTDQDFAPVMQRIIAYAEKSSHSKPNRTLFKPIKEVTIKPIDWLIEDFVEGNSLAEIFGPPESGKSLLAIDWGLCIAAGIDWRGHKTQAGSVFYVCGEGHNGLSRRFAAWGLSNDTEIDNLPFFQSSNAIGLYNIEGAFEAERAIAQALKANPPPPKLIIIDTLARNFGTGSENSTEDMSLFIAHIDKHLRLKFNCTVLIVHHTGHGATERGRGSSALKAAVDTEFCLSKSNGSVINLSCTKMKDAAHPSPKSFTISSIALGITDEKGQEAKGPILIDAAYASPESRFKSLGKNQKVALETLQRLYEEQRQNFIAEDKNPDQAKVTIKSWREQTGMALNRFGEVRDRLMDNDLIRIDDEFVYLQ